MAQAPAEDQKRLVAVQEIDTAIAQARHKLDNLEAKQRLAAVQARAAQITMRRIEAETAVNDIRREVAKAEDDVQAVRARAKRDQERSMTPGMTPRELEGIQSELEALARRQAVLEEVELEVMQRLEDAEAVADGVVAESSQIDKDVAALEAEVAEQAAAIEAELVELAAKRTNEAFGLDQGLMDLYEKLRAANGGLGAAPLHRGSCGGCRININAKELDAIQSRPADAIVRCEECGRILVRVQ